MAGEEPRTLEEFKKFKVPAKAAHASDDHKAAVKSACKAQSEYFGWKEGVPFARGRDEQIGSARKGGLTPGPLSPSITQARKLAFGIFFMFQIFQPPRHEPR